MRELEGFKVGDRVTREPSAWYDGGPVAGWPNPLYVSTIVELFLNHGLPCAWTRKANRIGQECEALTGLVKVPNPAPRREEG